jgi:hypothetical protein
MLEGPLKSLKYRRRPAQRHDCTVPDSAAQPTLPTSISYIAPLPDVERDEPVSAVSSVMRHRPTA